MIKFFQYISDDKQSTADSKIKAMKKRQLAARTTSLSTRSKISVNDIKKSGCKKKKNTAHSNGTFHIMNYSHLKL